MNRTEQAWAAELEVRKRAGDIRDYRFESIALRLGLKTNYWPDFVVVTAGGELEVHEVKGFWRDDARAKIKVAATQFPWMRFLAIQKGKGRDAWKIECIEPHG